MPTGTPYNSFILPYPIRVDDFADSAQLSPWSITTPVPALHLLTHTHSDHINGLSAKSFGYTVICSQDAKEMLLRHEVSAERALYDQEFRAERMRTFSHLKTPPLRGSKGMFYHGSRDLLVRAPFTCFASHH
jgi:DNA cross-link repair 1C protein